MTQRAGMLISQHSFSNKRPGNGLSLLKWPSKPLLFSADWDMLFNLDKLKDLDQEFLWLRQRRREALTKVREQALLYCFH